jgi:hypothetical protein
MRPSISFSLVPADKKRRAGRSSASVKAVQAKISFEMRRGLESTNPSARSVRVKAALDVVNRVGEFFEIIERERPQLQPFLVILPKPHRFNLADSTQTSRLAHGHRIDLARLRVDLIPYTGVCSGRPSEGARLGPLLHRQDRDLSLLPLWFFFASLSRLDNTMCGVTARQTAQSSQVYVWYGTDRTTSLF